MKEVRRALPPRRFWTYAALIGVFLLCDIALFSWLIFRSLSERELERILLETKQEAEQIAGRIEGSAERTGGDLYTAIALEQETETYIDSALRQREVVKTYQIRDKNGVLVMQGRNESRFSVPAAPGRTEPPPGATPRVETKNVEKQSTFKMPGPQSESARALEPSDPEHPEAYRVTVPIGDLGSISIGLSEREVQQRIGVLRQELTHQATLIAAVTLGLLVAGAGLVAALLARSRVLEEQAAEAERLAYLGTLAAGLAHEIRNPLNSLNLNMQMLDEDLGAAHDPPTSRRLVAITRDEIGRLERLVTDFLSYARPRHLHLANVPAIDLLDKVRELLAGPIALRGAEVEVLDESRGACVRVDMEQMQQLLINLVQNALAATDPGERKPKVVLSARRQGPRVLLAVEDNGAGIAPEERDRIFDLFYSTRKGGTGLGLAIVNRIVKAHRGELNLETEVGAGTKFTLALPIATAAPAPAHA